MAETHPTASSNVGYSLLGGAALIWLAGMMVSGFAAVASGAADGSASLIVQILSNTPLWVAFAAGAYYGATHDRELARRIAPVWSFRDFLVGVTVGVVSQFVLLWVLYQVLLRRVIDPDTVDDAARRITDQISGVGDLIALLIFIGMVAPVLEELFFRGLLYRGLEHVAPRWVAVVGSAFIFAAVHFQLVQFAGLFVFGLVLAGLVAWTDRLGAAVWAHIAFNVSTVLLLGLESLPGT